MFGLPPALRAPVLCGLFLAAPYAQAQALSARAPHINPTPADPNPATVTAVSECHFHGTVQYCQAGTTEFRISGSVTASSYTDCHGHGAETWCMAETGEVHIVAAQATGTITAPATQADPATSVTAVSDCHLHGSSLYCMVDTTEYYVHTTVTATQDVPPAFTGCHAHGSDTYCQAPDGDEVEISLAGEEADSDDDSGDAGGENCHFHAGVEHCVGHGSGEESQRSCERRDRDYNIGLRVGLLFVIFVTSGIGVFAPIFAASFISVNHIAFTILRQFGTGVIISTAFVHLFTHAVLMFQNECLGELAYEATTAAIVMAGLFLSFLVEYAGNRLIQWHEAKRRGENVESAGTHASPSARADMVNITVLELGIIFHSLLIGLTLVVAGDTFFITLFIVILFHQVFEGIALGTRIAALGKPCLTAPAGVHSHGHGIVSSHGHAHGHEHYHAPDNTTTTAAAAAATATTNTAAGSEPKGNAATADDSRSSTHSQAGGDSGKAGASVAAAEAAAHVPMHKKLLLGLGFALVTPVGMAIGIGVLNQFNGNDPATIVAIGTLDALSAGILVWVGLVEMLAHDWMLGGEMTRASPLRTLLGLVSLVAGMVLMSFLGKWA